MSRKHIPIFLILLSITIGCSPKQSPEIMVTKRIDWSQETGESIKQKIHASAGKLTILSAFFTLSMNPPPKKMMSSMSGVITIDHRNREPKVRIQAFHLFGSTLFDMVQTNIVKIYVPRKNTMYTGEKDTGESGIQGPQTVFANMVLDADSLVLNKDKPLHIGKNSVILYLENGWLSLDKETGLVIAKQVANMTIYYSEYTTLAEQTIIPTKISIVATDGSYKAQCTLSKLATPTSLPQGFFDLTEYRPGQIKSLAELQE